jgi:hypothetical protein
MFPWWYPAGGPKAYRIREILRGVWDLHAMYGADAPWLWRGQPDAAYRIEPAMHTRVRINGLQLASGQVRDLTRTLLTAVRKTGLDLHEGMRLPDMPLLAMLQHHGAATPLLDVSLDPVVGLYMAVVSPNPTDSGKAGTLFAIRRPSKEISAYDSRDFPSIWESLPEDETFLYSAPDVSERLRIQRGHFLLGRVSHADRRATIPLTLDTDQPQHRWITKRMNSRGKKDHQPRPQATSRCSVSLRPTSKTSRSGLRRGRDSHVTSSSPRRGINRTWTSSRPRTAGRPPSRDRPRHEAAASRVEVASSA